MPVIGGLQLAEICTYHVNFVRRESTKDIRSYAARYLELRTLPYTFNNFPYNVLEAWHRERMVDNLLSAAEKAICLWFDRV